MNDDELDRLLDAAAAEWRVPVDPPLDEIWAQVAARSLAPRRRGATWTTVGIAAAAALVLGVLGGRYSARPDTIPVDNIAVAAAKPAPSGYSDDRAMGELLGRTAVLLAALPSGESPSAGAIDPEITREGARLLTTTRLLLDSPGGNDPRLRGLLQDLELVLAQVARLEPRHHRDEMQFIESTLDANDLVPRLRSAAADYTFDSF